MTIRVVRIRSTIPTMPLATFPGFVRSVATGLAAVGLALPLAAQANCRIKTIEMPVKMVGSRAVATVGINGTPVPLTVDSGASFSMLTDAAAAQLNLPLKRDSHLRVQGLVGRAEVRVTKVEKLELLGGDVPGIDFIVGGNEPGAGTMGLMGRNLLSITDTEYDLAHGVIRFHIPTDCGKSNMAYWAGSTPVTEVDIESTYGARTPPLRAKVKLDGQDVMALFDSGAGTVVFARTARRLGIAEADMKPAGIAYGVGRGVARSWTAPFSRFELGGEAITNNTLQVTEYDVSDADMLIGIDFFLSHRIYVSNAQSKMYLTYAGGKVFSLNKSVAASVPVGDVAAVAVVADRGAEGRSADELSRRGAASAARGDFAAALADLDRACALEPTSATYLAQRGTIQAALKHPAKAIEDFDQALALDPGQPDARSNRAMLRFASKDRDGARADLDALDRTLAPQAQMRLGMGMLYLQLEQPAQALSQFDQWLPAHPNELARSAALHSRCLVRLRLGIELDKALDDCDDAVSAASKSPAYLDSRGWVYLRLGRHRNARSDFDRSLELQPTNASALYGRGLTKTRQGDAADGDADLAAARKLVPDIEAQVAKAGRVPGPAAKS